MKVGKSLYLHLLTYSLCALVILFQFQYDIPLSETTLRIGLSDSVLPLLLLSVIFVTPKKIVQQTWQIKWLPIWFMAFTIWLGVCLLIGYLEAGFISNWALGNKFIGWLILIGYFLAGGFTKNLNNAALLRMFKVLFITNWIVIIYCITAWVSQIHFHHAPLKSGVNENHRFIGFLLNPNAFGFFNVVLLLLYISINIQKLLFSKWLTLTGYILSFLSIIGSGSRGAIIALICGIALLLTRKLISFRFFSFLTIGIVTILGVLILINNTGILPSYFIASNTWSFSDPGVLERIYNIQRAFSWWLENPVTGIGLGTFLNRQIQVNPTQFSSIHQTPVWLLTELGLVGFILMAVFAVAATKRIYQASITPQNNGFAIGGLAMIAACAFASLTSEIMYQRYLWFFLGMLLAQPMKEKEYKQSVERQTSDANPLNLTVLDAFRKN